MTQVSITRHNAVLQTILQVASSILALHLCPRYYKTEAGKLHGTLLVRFNWSSTRIKQPHGRQLNPTTSVAHIYLAYQTASSGGMGWWSSRVWLRGKEAAAISGPSLANTCLVRTYRIPGVTGRVSVAGIWAGYSETDGSHTASRGGWPALPARDLGRSRVWLRAWSLSCTRDRDRISFA
jgi:hypothetical protein